ncbi:MAG: branched-chain amino acid ABC transporter permease [Acidimicrobiia bacterium]
MTAFARRLPSLLGWVPLIGGALLIGLGGDPLQLHVVTLILIWALWGTSFNIVWGYGGQFSMAQIALGAGGAYTVAILNGQMGLNFWLALAAAVLVAVSLSIIIGVAALRLSGFYFAIMTLAFASLLLRFVATWDRVGRTTGMAAAGDFGTVDVGSLHWELASKEGGLLLLSVVTLSLVLLAIGRIERTRTGRALLATREDETLASSLGVAPIQYRLLAFALSAVVAVFAGVLYGAYLRFISPSFFGTAVLITLIVQVVIGGAGHRFGPVLGATIYIGMTEYYQFGGEHAHGFFGAALIVMVLIAPNGILGRLSQLVNRLRQQVSGLPAPTGAPAPTEEPAL